MSGKAQFMVRGWVVHGSLCSEKWVSGKAQFMVRGWVCVRWDSIHSGMVTTSRRGSLCGKG